MSNMIKEKLFGNLDFNSIGDNPDFKEDSVREVIILPILKELGYTNETIVRSKSLQHPILMIGSKKRPITLFPDYCLKVQNSNYNNTDLVASLLNNLSIMKYIPISNNPIINIKIDVGALFSIYGLIVLFNNATKSIARKSFNIFILFYLS